MEGSSTPPPAPVAKKSSCLPKVLIGLLVVVLVAVGLWWWFNRPIQPVVLSATEKAAVEAKVEAIQKPTTPTYEKGSKEIILTERELNGLLNERTTLGKTVQLELVDGAIHARIESDLDKDLPVVGGKHLKARARFLVGNDPQHPNLVLDDVTVWGISLPNDWLGGMKGHDLLGETIGGKGGSIPGVEDFKIENGRLVIHLKD